MLLVFAVAGTSCGPTLGDLNANPEKYYEQKVSVRGRVSRRQLFPDQALLELADTHERRIIVRMRGSDWPDVDEWVKVTGVLVGELDVDGNTVYDAIAAERVRGSRRPRF